MLVDGQEGTPAQLTQAVDEVRRAVDSGGAVLATVLIGSNDLWYLYEYGPAGGTPTEDEDAAVATYRENLNRAVGELQDTGALVVVGLPDDQSLRPGVADLGRLQDVLPNVTAEEVEQMSSLSERFDRTAEEVAAEHSALVVDTNGPFWADPSKMADDGIHPNGAGYADLAALWMEVIRPAL
jgi:lysophospholipase L1-like esterase